MISRNRRVVLTFVLSVAAIGCDKVPLLAPTESTITLSAASTTVQANGSTTLTATVLEKSGTAVQNGTLVSFTTTVGQISPSEARTKNGQVNVTFSGNGQSGEAEIRANSGGATTKDPVKIKVGGAAVARIQLTASPGTVPSSGGSSEITAVVTDANGNPLSSVAVNFSTTAGTLSNATSTTDAAGQARTTLTTNREATVTATAGAVSTGTGGASATPGTVIVRVNVVPQLSVTAPSTITAGVPASFTVGVTTGSGASPLRDATISFGDGTSQSLGAPTANVTVTHVYTTAGTYTVTVSGTDVTGDRVPSVSTVIVVQPLLVSITTSQSASGGTTTVTFTANITGSAPVASYAWNFGDSLSATTTSATVPHTYVTGSGAKTVTVTVTATSGQTASGSTVVVP